jgi:nucleotide-binding universal stress UspA family protein
MVKKLLCATDGSKASEKAVKFAVNLAKTLGSDLRFITVNTATAERTSKTHFWDAETIAAADAQIHNQLGTAAKVAAKAGLGGVTCVTVDGRSIAAAIVDYAEKNGYDHVVMGSSGKTGATRLLLGSVAAAVVARAHCAVTIAR